MNCILLSIFLLFTIIGKVFGRVVNFNIITFGKNATVTVNGNSYDLSPLDDFSGIQTGAVICPDEEFQYYYTVNGKQESFTRPFESGGFSTHNDFFGRKETISPLKGMGYPSDKPRWNRTIGPNEVFDDSYIPTIILDSGSSEYFTNPYNHDNYTIGRFTMILKDEVFTETDVPSKSQNRYQDKFQWRVRLEKKIHKRRVFKFRANPDDPTFLRQAIYGDMVRAVGNPVHNQIIVRVYLSDGTPIGLYLMIEVTSSKSFIKSQFYGNELTGKISVPETGLGYPLDCSTGADFIEGSDFSSFKYSEGEDNKKIKYLTRAMHSLDVYDEEKVKKFSKEWLDLDTFFKALAFEYLTGHWDSYWMFTSNFVMYDAPEESTKKNYKFYFIDQDFDQTFGIGLSSKVNLYGDEFPSQSYKTLVDRTWNIEGEDHDGPHRAAIDIFLRGGNTTTMFENHLIDIVKHVFNPVAANRRINEYVRRYADEIKWDYSIDRLHIATETERERYVWTISDFYDNVEDVPKENVRWGLKQWIKMRAKAVAKEFDFEWDSEPLDPVVIVPVKNSGNDKDDDKDDEDEDKDTENIKNNATAYAKSSAIPSFNTHYYTIFIVITASVLFGYLL